MAGMTEIIFNLYVNKNCLAILVAIKGGGTLGWKINW